MSEHQKRRFFWAITLAIPLLVFAGLESVLRFLDYGGDLRLVLTRSINGVEYHVLNRDVGRRYFTQQNIGLPEMHDEPFALTKPSGTKRVIMLGESTMAGFPFDYNATPPDLLRDRLSAMYPGVHFEVINAGLSAINSYAVCDFAEELAAVQPDLFIVYLGHNEFYGALGVGSSEFLGRSSAMIRAYLRLTNWRTFRHLRDGIRAVHRWFRPEATPADATLMEAMVREKVIPFASEEYFAAREIYQENLWRIIAVARKNSIPLVLSTVTSNLRDQKPLRAAFQQHLPETGRLRWETLYARGHRAFASGDFPTALACFDSCVLLDNFQADGQYSRARTLDTLGRWDEAARAYRWAKDYDVLRFRASDDFNDVVRQTCAEAHVPCADVERAFMLASPHGIAGNNLMLEHLHPTFDGYFLMAKVFAETVADSNMLREPSNARVAVDDGTLRSIAGVTPFELEVGRCRIARLLDNWPFHDAPLPVSSYVPRDTVGELAFQHVRNRISWSGANYAIAKWYVSQGNFEGARRQYYAVSKVAPYDYYPFMQMGDVERMMNQPARAESLYRLALTKQESPYIYVRIGMLLFDLGRGTEAVRAFEQTFAAEERSADKMGSSDRSMARFFLGAAYGKTGDLTRAKSNLRLAVEIDPQNLQAKAMLAKIP